MGFFKLIGSDPEDDEAKIYQRAIVIDHTPSLSGNDDDVYIEQTVTGGWLIETTLRQGDKILDKRTRGAKRSDFTDQDPRSVPGIVDEFEHVAEEYRRMKQHR